MGPAEVCGALPSGTPGRAADLPYTLLGGLQNGAVDWMPFQPSTSQTPQAQGYFLSEQEVSAAGPTAVAWGRCSSSLR